MAIEIKKMRKMPLFIYMNKHYGSYFPSNQEKTTIPKNSVIQLVDKIVKEWNNIQERNSLPSHEDYKIMS